MNRRPHILFIVADDHRFDAVRALGDPVVQTPALDALAQSGITFRRAYMMGGLSGAVCIPARASLLTGANPFRASSSRRVDDSRGIMTLNPDLAVLPRVFRDAGYHTYAIGKWHNDKPSFAASFSGGAKLFFGGMSDHARVPVHDFDPEGLYPNEARYTGEAFSTVLFTDAAIRFIREYDGEKPFFLYLAYTAPHDPRTAPPEYAARYDPERVPLPPNFLPEHPFDNGEMRIRDEQLAPWPRTPEVVRRHIADYYAMITHLDAHVGRLLEALEASGLADDTIVVYTADHGLAVGQHGLLGKQNLYEHSVRVPLLLRGPGLPAGEAIDALVHPADLFPTLCELTGTPVPPTVESHSLLPLISGERAALRDHVCAVYKDVQRMVTDGRWKLIRYYRAEERRVGCDRLQLFHLEADPWETVDLSSDPTQAARLRALADRLASWQREVGDPLADRPVLLEG